ncbi:serine hydrolase domain-containing protein [Amycolatopsis suaedae]|uniref:Class A beta-lactamase-related serine hydrolase n=1 Tax=Amycolatopsis suaedae TaxID=2510978 RepID=A0A4Q7J1N4_9PSEU|nr:serine hydrolase domain-containing protein [Amycolatopsis suaedae]RZQ60779.1 class A beta-lactamase-related serine hydrolase [Amycolatopsis suaedae]
MKRTICTLVVAMLAAVTISAGTSTGAAPEHRPGFLRDVERILDRMTMADGLPGAQATVLADGRQFTLTSGVGDRGTGRPMPGADGYLRGASNVKPMVSTVILQLAGEGKVALDGPLSAYLPGVVPPTAGDAGRIRVRHLLQHTSGLHNHSESMPEAAEAQPFKHYTRQQLLDAGFSKGPDFPPGEKGKWHYSNTGYILLGLIIEKVTGNPWRDEVTRRVLKPAGMSATYFPAPYEYGLRQPHARGYLQLTRPDGGLATADATEFDPSQADANGDGISTPRDLLRFYTALLGGKLLRPDLLAEMRKYVPTGESPIADLSYGLGLGRMALPCGGEAWGHGGNLDGFQTLTAVTVDGQGRVVTAANVFTNTTFTEANMAGARDQFQALYAALCR